MTHKYTLDKVNNVNRKASIVTVCFEHYEILKMAHYYHDKHRLHVKFLGNSKIGHI